MSAVSDRLAYAARKIAELERPSCGLSAQERAFEMRRIAVLVDSCADAVRELELVGAPAPSRREQEGWRGPMIERLAGLIGSFWPGTGAERRHQGAAIMLRVIRKPTDAMVDAGARELSPYATAASEISARMTQACDVWMAMVDQALQRTDAAP